MCLKNNNKTERVALSRKTLIFAFVGVWTCCVPNSFCAFERMRGKSGLEKYITPVKAGGVGFASATASATENKPPFRKIW